MFLNGTLITNARTQLVKVESGDAFPVNLILHKEFPASHLSAELLE
jgi:hypothetical protein